MPIVVSFSRSIRVKKNDHDGDVQPDLEGKEKEVKEEVVGHTSGRNIEPTMWNNLQGTNLKKRFKEKV